MPFGPHVIELLETALADAFKFHDELDLFVIRSGIPLARLQSARQRAEARNSRYAQAPKRYVARELLADLGQGGSEDDRLVAILVDGVCKMRIPDANPEAFFAISELKKLRISEAREAAMRREALAREQEEKATAAVRALAQQTETRDKFRAEFISLHQKADSPQQRGYALERFLSAFFEFEGLEPRGSFRIIGEQIDGSFSWNGQTHLLEAKWQDKPVAGAEFGAFLYKIEGKSADTRGLFISVNGYSQDAVNSLATKGSLKFICIDGAHLFRTTEVGFGVPWLLYTLWRHASETGEAFLPVSSPRFGSRK